MTASADSGQEDASVSAHVLEPVHLCPVPLGCTKTSDGHGVKKMHGEDRGAAEEDQRASLHACRSGGCAASPPASPVLVGDAVDRAVDHLLVDVLVDELRRATGALAERR